MKLVMQLPPRIAGAFLYAVACAASAAPYVPASDEAVLYELPPGAVSGRLAVPETQDAGTAALVARAWIEKARASGDQRFLGYAQGVLQPWWQQVDAPEGIPSLRATILQGRHQFDDALSELRSILERDPSDPQALLTEATVLRVTGRLEAAAASCNALRGASVGIPASICGAALRGMRGDLSGAIRAMDALEPRIATLEADLQRWLLVERADMAERSGDVEGAIARYQRALEIPGAGIQVRAALADTLLRAGRDEEALRILGGAYADALPLRLAWASRENGNPRLDVEQRLAGDYERARQRGDGHLREEGLFELKVRGRPAIALERAQENWKIQREPIDALLLAEAAVAAGNPAALAPLLDWLQRTGMQDARLEAVLAGSAS